MPPPRKSSLEFYKITSLDRLGRLGAFFYKPGILGNPWGKDIDNDGQTDIFVGFNDSKILSLLHIVNFALVDKIELFNAPDIVHEDYTDHGIWEGMVEVLSDSLDLNDDGNRDLLIWCNAQYSLHPRGLLAYSPSLHKVLWYFPTGGPMQNLQIASEANEVKIIFGTSAPRNDSLYKTDYSSYVYCLNNKGEIVWKRKFFDAYSNIKPFFRKSFDASVITVRGCVYPNVVDHSCYWYKLSLQDGSVLKEVKLPLGQFLNTGDLVLNRENSFLVNNEKYVYFYDYDFNFKKKFKLSNPIKRLESVIDNDGEDQPLYKVSLNNNKTRLYYPGLKRSFDLEDKFTDSNFYIIHIGSESKDCFFESKYNLLSAYILADGPSHLEYYGFWGLILIPTWSVIFLAIMSFVGYWSYRKLLLSSVLTRLMLKQSKDAVALFNNKGKIITLNDVTTELFNLNLRNLKHVDYREIFSDNWIMISEALDNCYSGEISESAFEFECEEENRTRKYQIEINSLSTIFKIKFGKIVTISDSTEHDMEVEIKSLYSALSTISHNIKNRIQPFLYLLDRYDNFLLGQKPNESVELKSLTHQNKIIIESLVDMLKKIALMGKSETKFQERTEVSHFINSLMDDFNVTFPKSVDFIATPNWDSQYLFINRLILKEALKIIVENGLQASQEGGKVQMSFDLKADKEEKSYLNIHIRDFGSGISSDKMKRLFKPMESNKGSGLGLYFVKQIIDQHNAKISVKSEVGKGSEFIINLPIFQNPQKELK